MRKLVLAVVIASGVWSCGPRDGVVHVQGVLIGTRAPEGPGGEDNLTPLEPPRFEEVIALDSDPTVAIRPWVVERSGIDLDFLKALDLRVRRAAAGAPAEGYVMLAYITEPLMPQDLRTEEISNQAAFDWHQQHNGPLLMVSHYWNEAGAQPTKIDAKAGGGPGDAYLIRRETDETSRIRMPWTDPRVIVIPDCALSSPRPASCADPAELVARCMQSANRCLDVSTMAHYLRVSMAAQVAAAVAAVPTVSQSASAEGTSVVNWVNSTFGTGVPPPPPGSTADRLVWLAGPASDGAPRLYWVPHMVGASGSPGIGFVFEMTIGFFGGGEATIRVPISILLELRDSEYAACIDPFVAADPAICGTAENNSARVLITARTALGIGARSVATKLAASTISGIRGMTPQQLGPINMLRMVMSIDLNRYRGEVTSAPIPAKTDMVLLPRQIDTGELSNLVDPGGTALDLWLLE